MIPSMKKKNEKKNSASFDGILVSSAETFLEITTRARARTRDRTM